MTTNLITRIHTQLRAALTTQLEAHDVAGFTCFFNLDDDSVWSNSAIPKSANAEYEADDIEGLIDAFVSRGRTPRLEYIAEFAPALASALERSGFVLEETAPLMISTNDTFKPAATVPQLQIRIITDHADPVAAMQSVVTIQRRSFGKADAIAATVEEAESTAKRFHANLFFLAELDGVPVGTGSLQLPYEGIAEVAGIATLTEFRRRGIASALTSAIAQHAFDMGLDTLFIMAADQNVRRIYARLGFEDCGKVLVYSKKTSEQ